MKKTLIASSVIAGLFAVPGLSVANEGGFWEDSTSTLSLRNLYFDGDYKNQPDGSATDYRSDREWGQAFMLRFNSGYTKGTIGLGADVFARLGVRLDSGNNSSSRRSGELFPKKKNGKAETEFGQVDVAGKMRFSNTEVKFGRGLQPSLPVIRSNDGRLLPQTYSGTMITSNEIDNVTLRAGQFDKASGRTWKGYDGLKVAGAKKDVNKFQYAGADAKVGDDLVLSYYYAKLKDYYKQHFLGALHTWQLGEGQLSSDFRFFDSGSAGANGNRDGDYRIGGVNNNGKVDNQAISAMFTYKRSNHSLGLGYQVMRGDSDFAFLNNGANGNGSVSGATAYLITDSQIGKFLHAGEKTWVGQYSYNFADYVPGLSFTTKYLRGSGMDVARNQQGNKNHGNGEWERDVRLDYKIQSGVLKDMGLSLRHASLRSDRTATKDKDEFRIYVTYDFVLL